MWQYNKFKKKRKTDTEKTSVPKTRKTNYVEKLDRVFSLYIRLRDSMPNGMCRCISCGQIKPFASMDCGHYWSRTHMGTRYDEDNCNAECSYCNRMSGGEHMIGYRANLIKKIGQKRFDFLEVKAHQICKRDDFTLKILCDEYKKKIEEQLETKTFYNK